MLKSTDKKWCLRRYKWLDMEIQELWAERERWLSIGEKVTASMTGMPSAGREGSRIETAAVKLAELDSKLDAKVTQLVRLRDEITTAIETVEDDELRILLRLRYINCMTWEDIAEEMHYSVRHVTRLHGYALLAIKMS